MDLSIRRVKQKLKDYKRVLQVTRKPRSEEFKVIIKITSIGVLIIGLIGFIVTILFQLGAKL